MRRSWTVLWWNVWARVWNTHTNTQKGPSLGTGLQECWWARWQETFPLCIPSGPVCHRNSAHKAARKVCRNPTSPDLPSSQAWDQEKVRASTSCQGRIPKLLRQRIKYYESSQIIAKHKRGRKVLYSVFEVTLHVPRQRGLAAQQPPQPRSPILLGKSKTWLIQKKFLKVPLLSAEKIANCCISNKLPSVSSNNRLGLHHWLVSWTGKNHPTGILTVEMLLRPREIWFKLLLQQCTGIFQRKEKKYYLI